MKSYTRRGDAGRTDLCGGRRVDKDALRIEALGTADELNACLGLADTVATDPGIKAILRDHQGRLFELGADLATPATPSGQGGGANSAIPRIIGKHVTAVEKQIDHVADQLPPMPHFILPGGCELAARLHLARTICRRAERLAVALKKHEPVSDDLLIYLNRLSDLLFVLARRANQLASVPDVPWRSSPVNARDTDHGRANPD